MQATRKAFIQLNSSCPATKIITFTFLAVMVILLLHNLVYPFYFSSISSLPKTSTSCIFNNQYTVEIRNHTSTAETETLISKLQDSVTFLPLKDLRFAETAMDGNTWFMSSFNDTYEENEAEYLYFPSQASKGQLLCIKASINRDGTINSYALAWPESLPDSAVLLKGLTFISSTYYDFENLWHGLSALAPIVGWSLKNGCLKPRRWVLFQQGALQAGRGPWLQKLTLANYGDIPNETFENGSDVPRCFQKALVMRHDVGKMGREKGYEVFEQIRCKARSFCGINPGGEGQELNKNGVPIIRLTLLMRQGRRAFRHPKIVTAIFKRECEKVEGCILKVVQSDDLNFCDQVEVLTYTDILASPHGAQLTNMIFMDRNSTVMEFIPKGWLEFAGMGQYCYHWLADQAGMKHPPAWREKLVKNECPNPKDKFECWQYYKYGQVGHDETYFAEWARTLLNEVKLRKEKSDQLSKNACAC